MKQPKQKGGKMEISWYEHRVSKKPFLVRVHNGEVTIYGTDGRCTVTNGIERERFEKEYKKLDKKVSEEDKHWLDNEMLK